MYCIWSKNCTYSYKHTFKHFWGGGGGGGGGVEGGGGGWVWRRLCILRWECFYFFCFFTFINVPLSCLFFSFVSSALSPFSPFLWEITQNDHKGWHVVKPQLNQSSIFRDFTLQPIYFYALLYKIIWCGTHLNCLDKSRQYNWVPTSDMIL